MIDVSTSTSGWGMHAGSDVVTFATSSGGCQGRAVRQRPSDRRAQEAGAGRHEGPRRGDRPGRGARCRQEHPAGAHTHHIARPACRTGGGHQRRTATSVRGPPARVRRAARPLVRSARSVRLRADRRGGPWQHAGAAGCTARALPDGDGIRTAPGAGVGQVAAAGLDARRGERPAGLGAPGAAGGRGGAAGGPRARAAGDRGARAPRRRGDRGGILRTEHLRAGRN